MKTIYENRDGEVFKRESDTYGCTSRFDKETATREEMDAWLEANGFSVIGFEK